MFPHILYHITFICFVTLVRQISQAAFGSHLGTVKFTVVILFVNCLIHQLRDVSY